jgi:hypothetical protein
MSIRNKPNYGLYPINLTNQGTQDLPLIGTRVALVTALLNATFANIGGTTVVTGGTVAPATVVNVQVGKALGDPIPFSINTKINVDEAFEYLRFTWAATPNVTAIFMVADDREGAGVFIDAPAAILGGAVSISSLVSPTGWSSVADVVCAAGAQTQLVALNGVVRRSYISNPATNAREIRVGDNGAAAGEGLSLYPGDPPLAIKTSAAIFAWNPHTAAMPISIGQENN